MQGVQGEGQEAGVRRSKGEGVSAVRKYIVAVAIKNRAAGYIYIYIYVTVVNLGRVSEYRR